MVGQYYIYVPVEADPELIWELEGVNSHFVKFLGVGAKDSFDAPVEFRRARWQNEESYTTLLALGLNNSLKSGAAIHMPFNGKGIL